MKEDLNKWKDVYVHGLEDNIKMAILPKAIYRFNTIPIEISMAFFFWQMEKQILKFIWDFKGPIWPETLLKKNNKVGAPKLLDFKIYYKASVIKRRILA